jgi:3-oxoacyl-(acyl-carrier-protein) synthase/acyl carrier protein
MPRTLTSLITFKTAWRAPLPADVDAMNYHVIHENELGRHPEWAEFVRGIDQQRPPVGYERLLYPWFFIVPSHNTYVRLIRADADKLIIPLLPIDEAVYEQLLAFGRDSGAAILLVDRYHKWLDQPGVRLMPVGVLQNVELDDFHLRGKKMQRLRYMVNRFAHSGEARTVEYIATSRPPAREMIQLMEAWGQAKKNVIWHSALCMEHLLQGELPRGHRAFLTFLDGSLCSILVIEACGEKGYLMDQEFYSPELAPLGHMEYAIVEMSKRLREEGQNVLSLGATWYPFPFIDHARATPECISWLKRGQERQTLLGKIFEQGRTNYQFKKKFGVEGEPLFAYIPEGVSFPSILHYWSVFYENSLTAAQLSERLRPLGPPAPPPLDHGIAEREALWITAKGFEEIPYTASPLDLMSDSWLGRESEAVRARTAQLTAQAAPTDQNQLRELFPFKHLLLTRRGRDAEALFYAQFPRTKRKIVTTIPWTSTLMHQLANGFEVIELPAPSSLSSESKELFKGEYDLDALETCLSREGSKIGMAGIELLSNGTGGHPVRLSHLRKVRTMLADHGIPLVLDASRIVRNAVLLKRHDPECKDFEVWELARQLLTMGDHIVTSLTKDFAVPAGGLIATNDDGLAKRISETQAAQALEPNVAVLIEQSLALKSTLIAMLEDQLNLTSSLGRRLAECGVPICEPACGHALAIDCGRFLSEPASKAARENFLRDLFVQTGIRGGIHQVGQQRQGLLARCLRLAFPLGLGRAHEEMLFEKLRSFLAARNSADRSSIILPHAPSLGNTTATNGAASREGTEITTAAASLQDEVPASGANDIAIIGLSGRYPGAENHYEFWAGLQNGRNFVTDVPLERWDHKSCFDPSLGKEFVPHRTRCRFGAFLHGHDLFDAEFFNLSPTEVVMMDPQERIAMEVVWSCVEDAGYTSERLGRDVGLFSGITYNEYQKLIPRTTHSCFLTSRLAYFLNFQGPAVALDTGCASSMAALDAACQNLRDQRCQVAVVIGANLILHPDHYASLSPELSTTATPLSAPFGDADGWIPAEGVVAVLLKPLALARRDGDHIHAVIKSTAMGHEGKTSWFSAFSPKSQSTFLHRSFERAGISPATISYVEAAANGSPLGDAIELEALTSAFRKWTKRIQDCPIGTVKANTGHAEGVSTLLQLTKLLLQFKAGEIYPLLQAESRNPNIRIEETPFRLPSSVEAWDRPEIQFDGKRVSVPRRATISSFGGGGNMGHVILEEPPAPLTEPDSLPLYLIPVSAKTQDQLRHTVAAIVAFFEKIERFDADWVRTYQMLHVMHTLCLGRVEFAQRVAFVVSGLADLKAKCQRFLRGERADDIILPLLAPSIQNSDMTKLLAQQSWHELGQRWVNGHEIPWGTFFSTRGAKRLPLPTYCFDRKRHEISTGSFERALAKSGSVPHVPPQESAGAETTAKPRQSDYVERAFSRVLKVDPDALDVTKPLDRYGFDSTMVVEIAAELSKRFQQVPLTLFFDCGTINEVIDCLRAVPLRTDGPAAPRPLPNAKQSNGHFDFGSLTEGILSRRLTAAEVLKELGESQRES